METSVLKSRESCQATVVVFRWSLLYYFYSPRDANPSNVTLKSVVLGRDARTVANHSALVVGTVRNTTLPLHYTTSTFAMVQTGSSRWHRYEAFKGTVEVARTYASYPFLPGTTPYAGPFFPYILRRSPASFSGTSKAAKCPPAS